MITCLYFLICTVREQIRVFVVVVVVGAPHLEMVTSSLRDSTNELRGINTKKH
jgi:hypothetical protein